MAAEGDIIVRTDADTIFPRDILTKTVSAFENPRIIAYHVGHLYYDGNILLNLFAHLYDKYWRSILGTPGHFIAVRRSMYKEVAFKPLAKGQDFEFGKRVYELFGQEAFAYDPNTVVLISSRAVRKQGMLRYILHQGSFRSRRG
jgi:cellulose synthase/poly-beta-1,6-N-acetylglucosamine synthase-like glycosyltransferase